MFERCQQLSSLNAVKSLCIRKNIRWDARVRDNQPVSITERTKACGLNAELDAAPGVELGSGLPLGQCPAHGPKWNDLAAWYRVETILINISHRIAEHELVEVQGVFRPNGIGRHPSAHPGRVVAVTVIIKTGCIVALLTAKAVVFDLDVAHTIAGDERGATVWEVLLIRHYTAILIKLDG